MPRAKLNLEEILLCVHENFKEENKVLEPSIIINYFTIIINNA
jgi:hypothetical protein